MARNDIDEELERLLSIVIEDESEQSKQLRKHIKNNYIRKSDIQDRN